MEMGIIERVARHTGLSISEVLQYRGQNLDWVMEDMDPEIRQKIVEDGAYYPNAVDMAQKMHNSLFFMRPSNKYYFVRNSDLARWFEANTPLEAYSGSSAQISSAETCLRLQESKARPSRLRIRGSFR